MGLYLRGSIWWCDYTHDGARRFESTGKADRREAARYLSGRRREIDEGTWQPRTSGALATAPGTGPTVAAFVGTWLARRREAGVLTVEKEAARLRQFVVPALGAKALGEVKRSDVRDLMAEVSRTKIKTAKKGTEPRLLSPRSVLHVYAAMRAMFADAVVDEIIAATPCTLRTRKGELPTKRDADPRWRSGSVYTRDEAQALISDPRVPPDRVPFYALGILAGLRAGEIIGRRWRDLDAEARPLGQLLVATQYDDAETKTGEVREVPVHPVLAEILDTWRRTGFALAFGRHPTPDDWILPARSDVTAQRSVDTLERMKGDLDRLGFRSTGRGRHAMRATFLTLLELDGANMAIARRATHAAAQDVVSGYVRTGWPALCNEVSKLALVRHSAAVVPLRLAVGGPECDSECDSDESGSVASLVSRPLAMTPRGLEPLLPA